MSSDVLSDVAKDNAAAQKWLSIPEHHKKLASMAFYEALLKGGDYFLVTDYIYQKTSRGLITIYYVEISVGEFAIAVPSYVDGLIILVDFDLWDTAMDLVGTPPDKVC